MSHHVEEERLLAFTLGQLAPADAHVVEGHLQGCEECHRRQQRISSVAFARTAAQSTPAGVPTRPEGDTRTDGATSTLARGATLGRYVLLEKLGSGGMGEVFAAYDPQLDRKVALKLLRGGALSAEEGRMRLQREAQAMARLQHPNVIAVHDVGLFGDRVFVAMEYVEGETLTNWLRGRRDWRDIVEIFRQAGQGLAAAHRAGLVHRDFKPDNVLLGEDQRPRVLDFGLARQAGDSPAGGSHPELEALSAESTLAQRLTRDGAVMGTPGYMPPEQLTGLATDARSDQFSFCVALWEALYGNRPFSGSTLKQHAQEITAGNFIPPPSDTSVPGWIASVLRRGLSANGAERWPDMDSLLKALRPRRQRNWRRTLFFVALGLFSLFGLGYGAWTRQRLLLCGGAEQRLVGVWDHARQQKLKDAFLHTRLSYAEDTWLGTARVIDGWTAEWLGASREVCEASRLRKVDTPEQTAIKNECLDARLAELEGLVALFDSADREVVNSAPSAVLQLQRPTSCTSAIANRHVEPEDTEARQAELALHQGLADARTLYFAGKYEQSARLLDGKLDPRASPELLAEGHLWLARIEQRRGEPGRARQATLVAAEQALKAGDSALLARALSRLYATQATEQPDPQVDAWGRLAAASASRIPDDWQLAVDLARDDATVNLARHRYKAALADSEQVLGLQREHLGEEHPEIAATLNDLGVVLTRMDRLDEAVARYRESVALHEKLEGGDHPNVAAALHNYGVALRRLGRSAEARAALQRALDIRSRALGERHPDTLHTQSELVQLLLGLGDLEAARVQLDALIDARARTDDDGALQVLALRCALLAQGAFWPELEGAAAEWLELARARHDVAATNEALLMNAEASIGLASWADARRAIGEVLRHVVARDGPVDLGRLRELEGRLELAQGRAGGAVKSFELAVASEVPGSLAAAKHTLWLARALNESGQAAKSGELLRAALPVLEPAENPQWLEEARALETQARWLSDEASRAETGEQLRRSVDRLRPESRAWLTAWVREHVPQADAGR